MPIAVGFMFTGIVIGHFTAAFYYRYFNRVK